MTTALTTAALIEQAEWIHGVEDAEWDDPTTFPVTAEDGSFADTWHMSEPAAYVLH